MVIALWPSVLMAGESGELCPARIETEQKLTSVGDGFEVVDQKRFPKFLFEVVFYQGRPEEQLALKYDSENETGAETVYTYNLDKNSSYWIRCGYFATSITLARPLPPTDECTVVVSSTTETKLSCR